MSRKKVMGFLVFLLIVLCSSLAYADNFVAYKLNELRHQFPDGKYWNHYIDSNTVGYDAYEHKDAKWKDSVTDHPCNHNANYEGNYDCNCFDGASQCYGFANRIFYAVFGQQCTSLQPRYDMENVMPGDHVRIGSWTGTSGHSAIVIARSGNTLTLVECNYDYKCGIQWNRQANINEFSSFKHATNWDSVNQLVPISSGNFPDSNFRNCVKQFDNNGDGGLSAGELKAVKEIYCSYCGISSLKGIERFTNLEYLECSGNKLTSLDLGKNTKLGMVYCDDNKLSNLKISKNTELKYLICSGNQLTKLDVSGNKKIIHIECNNNKLTKLQLSQNSKLSVLECFENKLKSLDVTPCPYLSKIVQKQKRKSEENFDYFGSITDKNGLSVDRTVTVTAGKTVSEPTVKNISSNKLKYKISIPDKTATLTGVTDEKIKTIKIPDTIKHDGKTFKVTEVAPNACKGLSKLENLGFGKNIKKIGKNAFNGCKKLKSISFSGTSLKKIGSDAFKGIAAKATFTCEKKVLATYKKLIKNSNPPSSVKYKSNKGSRR